MNELTDLEICKRIAEIEGAKETLYSYSSFNKAKELTAVFDSSTHFDYNPLTDDALCFRLMIKYGIILMTSRPGKGKVVGYNAWYYELIDKVFVAGLNPNKAICLAIIKSKE
jgi:hypothetical protein